MEITLNFEKIWQLFQETDRKFQEMQRAWDRSFQGIRREVHVATGLGLQVPQNG